MGYRGVPGRLYASRPSQRDGGTWAALPATIDTNAGHVRYLHRVTNTDDAPLEHRCHAHPLCTDQHRLRVATYTRER